MRFFGKTRRRNDNLHYSMHQRGVEPSSPDERYTTGYPIWGVCDTRPVLFSPAEPRLVRAFILLCNLCYLAAQFTPGPFASRTRTCLDTLMKCVRL
jgi:hypothetical protein